MQRVSAIAFAAAVTLVPACSESSDSVVAPGTPALATRTDQNNDRLPFTLLDVDNPCTPALEAIDLEGVIHGQGSLWDNGHFKAHYNVELTGADADGVRYVGVSSGNGKGEVPTDDAVISTVISSNGATPNFVTKIVLHHLPDGTVTVDKSGEECRG
jgi:hypothetical protein